MYLYNLKLKKKMLTIFKEIFIWWNRQTLGTRINTLIFGKLVGTDQLGNKYYTDKNGRRWVIYKNETDASNIPQELNKFSKYDWQKEHKPNMTGTDKAYHPENNKNATKKKYNTWKN